MVWPTFIVLQLQRASTNARKKSVHNYCCLHINLPGHACPTWCHLQCGCYSSSPGRALPAGCMLFATKSYQHQSRLIANLTTQKLISDNIHQKFCLHSHSLAALLPTSLYSWLLEDNRGTRETTERGSHDMWRENLSFLEWLEHSSQKKDAKLESKVIYLQSMLSTQMKPTPNPCGLLFLDSERAGQYLPQLAPNPRTMRVHITFLLLLWNSSIPNTEDLCQGT